MCDIILKLHRATNVSLIKYESYQQSPEETKNYGENEKRDNINT